LQKSSHFTMTVTGTVPPSIATVPRTATIASCSSLVHICISSKGRATLLCFLPPLAAMVTGSSKYPPMQVLRVQEGILH